MNKDYNINKEITNILNPKDKKLLDLFNNIYDNTKQINKNKVIKSQHLKPKIVSDIDNDIPRINSVILNKKFKYNRNYNTNSVNNLNYNNNNTKNVSRVSSFSKITNIDIDELNNPYRKYSKLNPNYRLDPLLYNMLKNSNQLIDINNINNLTYKIPKDIENLYLLRQVNIDDNNDLIDESEKTKIGKDAIYDFYEHYKKLPKIVNQNNFYNKQSSLYTKLLHSSLNLKIIPNKYNFIKKKGKDKNILLQNQLISDKNSVIISDALENNKTVNKINLAGNRITKDSLPKLINSFQEVLIYLNLSNNPKIGDGLLLLADKIDTGNIYLKTLKIANTGITNKICSILLKSCLSKLYLNVLDISNNKLTEVCPELLGLLEQDNLRELYMRWNNFIDLSEFFKCASNSFLEVLDVAACSIGELGKIANENRSNISDLCNLIKKTKKIIHLDLSGNNFSLKESKEISNYLKDNKNIYGFHFDCNYGEVDDEGYLEFPEDSLFNNLKGATGIPQFSGINKRNVAAKNCWLCEEWREIEITCDKDPDCNDIDPLFVHFSFNNYKPFLLNNKKEVNGKYIMSQKFMVPIGEVYGFFSENFIPKENNNYPQIDLADDIKIKLIFENDIEYNIETNYINLISDDTFRNNKLKKFQSNIDKEYLINVKQSNNIAYLDNLNNTYKFTCQVKPRSYIKYNPPKSKKIKIPWTFPKSIFKDYQIDNDEILNSCFEFDYSNTKIHKLIKNEEDLPKVKELLRSKYREIKDCYKYLSASSVSGIWSISANGMLEFINELKIVDNKYLQLPEYDIIFAGVSAEKKFKNDQKNYIVRHKFLEIIVRIIVRKYVDNMGMKYYESFELAFTDSFDKYLTNFNHFEWRNNKYWNEECDYVLKSHKIFLEQIYKEYSGLKTLPGKKKFCSLEEFKKLVIDFNLLNENFFERDISIFFCLSIITIKDELNIDRVFECYFTEFLEVIARCADKINPKPLYNIYENDRFKHISNTNEISLHFKIESVIKKMYDNYNNLTFKKGYKINDESVFIKFYEVDE